MKLVHTAPLDATVHLSRDSNRSICGKPVLLVCNGAWLETNRQANCPDCVDARRAERQAAYEGVFS